MKVENPIKYARELEKGKLKCECGHSVIMPPNANKLICRWCGNYVFRNKRIEFGFRMKEIMNNAK